MNERHPEARYVAESVAQSRKRVSFKWGTYVDTLPPENEVMLTEFVFTNNAREEIRDLRVSAGWHPAGITYDICNCSREFELVTTYESALGGLWRRRRCTEIRCNCAIHPQEKLVGRIEIKLRRGSGPYTMIQDRPVRKRGFFLEAAWRFAQDERVYHKRLSPKHVAVMHRQGVLRKVWMALKETIISVVVILIIWLLFPDLPVAIRKLLSGTLQSLSQVLSGQP